MLDFEAQREELDTLRTEIATGIDRFRDLGEKEWDENVSILQKKFSDLQRQFGEFSDSISSYDEHDQDEARKFYAKMNTDFQSLESRFNQIKKEGFVKRSTVAEHFIDKEQPSSIPAPKSSAYDNSTSNVLEVEEMPRGQHIPDIEKPLNDLETDVETNETGEQAIKSLCLKYRKYMLIGGGICILIALICLVAYFVD